MFHLQPVFMQGLQNNTTALTAVFVLHQRKKWHSKAVVYADLALRKWVNRTFGTSETLVEDFKDLCKLLELGYESIETKSTARSMKRLVSNVQTTPKQKMIVRESKDLLEAEINKYTRSMETCAGKKEKLKELFTTARFVC